MPKEGIFSAPVWENFRDLFDPTHPVGRARGEHFAPFLEEYLVPVGSPVLDIGCGHGLFSFELARLGLRVTAIDISEEAIQQAQSNAEQLEMEVDFKLMDARNMVFEDKSFSSAILMGNDVSGFSITDFAALMVEAHRVTGDGGRFMMVYLDWIEILHNGYDRWHFEGENVDANIISFHRSVDLENGILTRFYFNATTAKGFNVEYHIWSPFLVRHIVEGAGFGLIATERLKPTYIDVFERG